MNKAVQSSLAAAVIFGLLLAATGLAQQRSRKRDGATSVTGTYKYVLNSLEVIELPDQKVRISFNGVWPNDHKRADTRNIGVFDETVPLNGRTAVVRPRYGNGECAITLEFRTGKVMVTQEGYSCGFGFNVEAGGTYLKTSSKRPKLPPFEPNQ